MRRRLQKLSSRTLLAGIALTILGGAVLAADFPYDSELLLSAAPMRGSKRIPMLEIGSKGDTSVSLWCNTATAQLVVAGETVTVLIGSTTNNQCEPERMHADEDLLAALQTVTGWHMQGDTLTLSGDKTLKFRLSSH